MKRIYILISSVILFCSCEDRKTREIHGDVIEVVTTSGDTVILEISNPRIGTIASYKTAK